MTRALTGADLGEAGESIFKTLCVRASLVCNKSTRDVTGWDFLVEFPMAEPSAVVPLDQRPTTACLVQLKSTASGGIARTSLRLSAVERLAKDARPAVIVVFLLRADGEAIHGYVIHLIGQQLAHVLKRLRLAHALKELSVNNASITFDYRKSGIQFELTPAGLHEALAKACGTNPAAYMREKQRQLAELGYENGAVEAEALIWVEGPEHLSDVLLGLVPVKPRRFRAFDSRFGIQIPYKGRLLDDMEELALVPPRIGACQISMRGPGVEPAATFAAEMFIGPPIPEIGGPQLLFRHPDFTLVFKSDRLEFQTVGNFDTVVRPLQRWIDLIRALTHMASGRCINTISQADPIPRLSLPLNEALDGPYIEQLPQIMRVLEGWQRLLNVAGVVSTAGFCIEEIWAAREVILAVDLMANSSNPISYFEFKTLDDEQFADAPVHALFFNNGKIGRRCDQLLRENHFPAHR